MRLHRAGRLLSALNAIPRPAHPMIPVHTIKVCIRLADLPNDSHCAPMSSLSPHLYRIELLVAGKKKAVAPGVALNGTKKALLVPDDLVQSANEIRCLNLTAQMLRFVQASCDYERNMPKLRACEHSIARFRNRMAIPTAKMRKIRGRGNHF
jgi:hypothetical protein